MQQFLEIFSELKNKKLYLTGESVCVTFFRCASLMTMIHQYAGTYLPCMCYSRSSSQVQTKSSSYVDIADYLYTHPGALPLNLQGIWMADRTCPGISYGNVTFRPAYNSGSLLGRCPTANTCSGFCSQIRTRFCSEVRSGTSF